MRFSGGPTPRLWIAALLTWIALLHGAAYAATPDVASGNLHTLGLASDGTVYAWGWNGNGQLGDGSTSQSLTPQTVSGVTTGVDVAAGDSHSVVALADGSVLAWGLNDLGQLGDGTTTQRESPVAVSGLSNVIAVSAGDKHSLALRSDGTVWAWGENSNGQLGDNSTTHRSAPVQVVGPGGTGTLGNIVALATGQDHSLALKDDGTVWAWGANGFGRLGDDSTTQRLTPVQVLGLSQVVAIAAGDEHSLAVTADGAAWGWGHDSDGQTGEGTGGGAHNTPKLVFGVSDAVAVSAGATHSLLLHADGTVSSVGRNNSGQIGDGTTSDTTDREVFAAVSGTSTGVGIAAGNEQSFAIGKDGGLRAWGANTGGQLGDGANSDLNVATQTVGVGGSGTLDLGATANIAPVAFALNETLAEGTTLKR